MARPAVFVSGVGGKTVRSRRVTEQWNRKRAMRKGEGEGREGGRDRERNRNTKNEQGGGDEEKEGRETVIFSCARFFVFYFPRMTAFYLRRTTQANDDACARDKRAR